MAGRGVLFAITEEDVRALEARDGTDELADYIAEVIEERWESGFVCEVNTAWEAIHRCLTDGSLDPDAGDFPLNTTILGREVLDAGLDYYVGLTRSGDVPPVADALRHVDERWIRQEYRAKVALGDAPEHGDADSDAELEYTVGCFEELPKFWQAAAQSRRAVIFTVDQ